MEKCKPLLTRKVISRYEFCACIGKLAEMIEHDESLKRYSITNNQTLTNSSEIALNLFKSGKADAQIHRPEEIVSFSELVIPEIYYEIPLEYFERERLSMRNVISSLGVKV